MKAAISWGLVGLMVLCLLPFGVRGLTYVFSDKLDVCTCGSRDVEFRPTVGPPGSTHRYYMATCKKCQHQWQSVDVAWDDPRKVIDATVEALIHEPEYLDE